MTRLDPVLGVVRLGARCGEWWPDDEEFYRSRRAVICRACHADARYTPERRASVREAARRYRARRRLGATA